MMKVQEMIDADTDPAMKEVDMAKMAMKDGKMADCSMHLDNAMKDMKMN